jgi:hypothetical protein
LVQALRSALRNHTTSTPPQKAPLTDQLFAETYERYNRANGLLTDEDLAECRKGISTAGSLEAWLTQRWQAIGGKRSQQTRSAELAFFGRVSVYLRELMQGVSDSFESSGDHHGYTQLLRAFKKRDEDFALVSFNYDTLLDRALQDVYGYPLARLEDYLEVPYLKPHGSVNWFLSPRFSDPNQGHERTRDVSARARRVAANMFNEPLLTLRKTGIRDPRHADLRSLASIFESIGKTQYCYPMILIPLTVKLYNRFKGFDQQILSKARECFAAAAEIFLLGYRAQDEVFSDLLSSVSGEEVPIHVADKGQAREIQERVLRSCPKLMAGECSDDGFMAFVDRYRTTISRSGPTTPSTSARTSSPRGRGSGGQGQALTPGVTRSQNART